MKIKGYHSTTLTLLVARFGLIAFPFSVFYLTQIELYYTYIAILASILIVKVGQHVAQHRYFSHRAFTTGPIREWILGFLGTLSTTGSPIFYSAIHRYHHAKADTEEDPHNPKIVGYWKAFLLFLPHENLDNLNIKLVRDLLKSKPARFFHDWYWPTIALYVSVLAIIDPNLIIAAYLIPMGYSRLSAGYGTTFSHLVGYQNFKTEDNSKNSFLGNLIFLGEGSHNNHHYKPNAYDMGFTGKWKEFDLSKPIIELFFKRGNTL